MPSLTARIAALPWDRLIAGLDADGHATTPPLLTATECARLAAGYDDDAAFRSRVVMARHGFGRGEYRYYCAPLPEPVAELRQGLYPRLVPLANAWAARLGSDVRYPPDHAAFLETCHLAGQRRPTPLLLRYGPSDYNCLHQDLYGPLAFPLQVAILLSAPDVDFRGGAFVLVEQRPRMQSRPMVAALAQGEAVIFATSRRPVRGARGDHAVTLRHGVSRIEAGCRHTMGIIFHDAQ